MTGRRGLLLISALAALGAVLGGLARLGVNVGSGGARAMEHGPLLVLGVFGTVISLERAVALGQRWSYTAPALAATAALGMLLRLPVAPWLAVGSAVALLAINVAIVRRQVAAFTAMMLIGSAVLVGGDVAWALGRPVFQVVPAWIAFFVLTIVAERLELSRLAPTPRWATRTLVGLALLFAAAVALSPRALGVVLVPMALWQLRFDLARRTVRLPGLPRYAATGVLLGAGWLLVAGVLFVAFPFDPAGPRYDAALHAVFVGFVLSLVFAHAPIILPAVARIEVPFHPVLYVPLAVLHGGLVARIAGDLLGLASLRVAGGLANAISLALFLAAVLLARAATGRGAERTRLKRPDRVASAHQ